MLQPVKRDEFGYGIHPLIPESEEEFIDLSLIPAFIGLTLSIVHFEDDANDEIQDHYFEKSDPDISSWQPTPPQKSSILIGVVDTETGPIAYFVSGSREI